MGKLKLDMKLKMGDSLKLGGSLGKSKATSGGSVSASAKIPLARIGVDIGSRYIKVAHVVGSSLGVHLVNFGYCATPIGAVNEGIINNPEAVGEAIGQILKVYNFKEKKIVCSLPGRSVVIRQINIPAGMPDKEVKQAIISEVERFMPFPLDEMEFTYHMLGEVMNGDIRQSSVLFIASHKDSVGRRVEATRFAGLESVEIDIDPFVLLRSVVESGLFENPETFSETLLLIDMGASATNVSIIHGGNLRFTRIFATGGDTFTHAIESGMDLSYLESEKIKMEKGVAILDEDNIQADEETRAVYDIISPHLESLALEIRRSLAYYTSKYRGESVTRILLTGGGSMLRGVGRFFEDDLGIPVLFSNPLASITYVGDGDTARLAKMVPFFGVAIGLAMRQVNPKILGRHTAQVNIETAYEFGSTAQAGGGGVS